MAIVQVRKATGFTSLGSSVTATFGATPAVNNHLFAIMSISNGVFANVTPPAGWTEVIHGDSFATDCAVMIFERLAGPSEPTAVTFLTNVNKNSQLIVLEYSGLKVAPTIVDRTKTNNSGSTNSCSTGTTSATTQADELVLGGVVVGFAGGAVTGVTNGFTDEGAVAGGLLYPVSKIVAATGTQESTVSWTNAQSTLEGVIATFKGALPAGPPFSTSRPRRALYRRSVSR